MTSLLTMGMLTSCDDNKDYEWAELTNNARAYFSVATMSEEVDDTFTGVPLSVFRSDNSESVTIGLTLTDASGLFSVPATVTFGAGDDEAAFDLSFDGSKLDANTTYTMKITIDEKDANLYGTGEIQVSILRPVWSEWEYFGTGTYGDTFWWGMKIKGVDVQKRYIPGNEKNCQYHFTATIEDGGEEYPFDIIADSSDGGNTLTIDEQYYDTHASYGTVWISDMYTYTGSTSYAPSTYNDITGTFSLDVIVYVSAGYFGYGMQYLQLDGFADTNYYNIDLTDEGMVTINDTNYALLSMNFNENVTYARYTVVNGALDEDEVAEYAAAMAPGYDGDLTVDYATIDASVRITKEFPASGDYTLVTVGFNQDPDDTEEAAVVKCTNYLVFSYTSFNPNAGWNEVGTVAFTDAFLPYIFDEDVATWDVTLLENEETPGMYRLFKPYENCPWVEEYPDDYSLTGSPYSYIEIDATNEDYVYITESQTGLVLTGYGELYVYSFPAYYIDRGETFEEYVAEEPEAFGSIKDGVFTMPSKSLLWYLDQYGGWYNMPDAEVDMVVDFNGSTDGASTQSRKMSGHKARNIENANVLKYQRRTYSTSMKDIKSSMRKLKTNL